VITHVLDTSAILAHYLREPGAEDVNAILARGPEAAGVSLITVVELRGRLAEVTTDAQEAERAFRLYTDTLTTVLPFSRETADAATALRSATRPRLPLVDALIAASAKQHAAVLVHRDPHMAAIPASLVSQLLLPPKQ
jgi:predicted nucleic acid-binding protein